MCIHEVSKRDKVYCILSTCKGMMRLTMDDKGMSLKFMLGQNSPLLQGSTGFYNLAFSRLAILVCNMAPCKHWVRDVEYGCSSWTCCNRKSHTHIAFLLRLQLPSLHEQSPKAILKESGFVTVNLDRSFCSKMFTWALGPSFAVFHFSEVYRSMLVQFALHPGCSNYWRPWKSWQKRCN